MEMNTRTFKITIRRAMDEVSMIVKITVVVNWPKTLCRLADG